MRPLITPGYVYVLAHPELPAWHKVGRTYRPPTVRALELSRTAWPTPLEVVHARFFWDSVAAEQAVHQALNAQGRRREFFGAPLPKIREVIQGLPVMPAPRTKRPQLTAPEWDAPWAMREGDAEAWHRDLDRREEEWSLGQAEVSSNDPLDQDRGWRRWMRLSSEGWAEGSLRLGDMWVRAHPGPQGAHQASWVLDAAAQGAMGAGFRAHWLRSWIPEADLSDWSRALGAVWHRWQHTPWEEWPELIRATLLLERQLVVRLPPEKQAPRVQAASYFGGWDRVIAAQDGGA